MDRKKTSEMIFLGGAVVLSLVAAQQAYAATACSLGTGTAVSTTASSFVKTGFTPKCSQNTAVTTNDSGNDFSVGSASYKGKTVYGASTAGGQVTVCTTAAAPAPASAPNASTGC